MKKEFKGKYFFLGEYDCFNDSEFQKMPYPDRIRFSFFMLFLSFVRSCRQQKILN